jgi:TetR/AcrR family transcriptional regulator, transcriptional repressor for nem operon
MPQGLSQTPKTQRGRASRERLVEAAAQSVVDHGIHQMRLDEVLASAGSSKSQMYHYFEDRDGLVAAAVEHRCAEVLAGLAPAFAGVDSIRGLGAVLNAFADQYANQLTGCPIGTLASELTSGPEPARQFVVEAFATWETYLAQALTRIRERGELRPDADPATLATGLLAALEGGMFLSQVRRDPAALRAALTAALGFVASCRQELD